MLRETDQKVEAHLSSRKYFIYRGADTFVSVFRPSRSSIALDANPGSDRRKRAAYAESYSDEVVFLPEEAYRKTNDEL